jgi:hypothetical protein
MNGIDSDVALYFCAREPALGRTLCEGGACNEPAGYLARTISAAKGIERGERLCWAHAGSWCDAHNTSAGAPGFLLVWKTAAGDRGELIDLVGVRLAETIETAGEQGRHAWEALAEEIGCKWLAVAVADVVTWPASMGGLDAVKFSDEMSDHLIGEVSAARWRLFHT